MPSLPWLPEPIRRQPLNDGEVALDGDGQQEDDDVIKL